MREWCVCVRVMHWPFRFLLKPSDYGALDVPSDFAALQQLRCTADYKQRCRRWVELKWCGYVDGASGNVGVLAELVADYTRLLQHGALTKDGFYYGIVSEYAVQRCASHWCADEVDADVYSHVKFHTTALELLAGAVQWIHQSTLHDGTVHKQLVVQLHTNIHWMANLVAYYEHALVDPRRRLDMDDSFAAMCWYRCSVRRSLWAGPMLGYVFTTVSCPVWADLFLQCIDAYLMLVMYVPPAGDCVEPASKIECVCGRIVI